MAYGIFRIDGLWFLSNRWLMVFVAGEEGAADGGHGQRVQFLSKYRATSLTRKRTPLGPYRGPMPRVLGGSEGVVRFLMGEVHWSKR